MSFHRCYKVVGKSFPCKFSLFMNVLGIFQNEYSSLSLPDPGRDLSWFFCVKTQCGTTQKDEALPKTPSHHEFLTLKLVYSQSPIICQNSQNSPLSLRNWQTQEESK